MPLPSHLPRAGYPPLTFFEWNAIYRKSRKGEADFCQLLDVSQEYWRGVRELIRRELRGFTDQRAPLRDEEPLLTTGGYTAEDEMLCAAGTQDVLLIFQTEPGQASYAQRAMQDAYHNIITAEIIFRTDYSIVGDRETRNGHYSPMTWQRLKILEDAVTFEWVEMRKHSGLRTFEAECLYRFQSCVMKQVQAPPKESATKRKRRKVPGRKLAEHFIIVKAAAPMTDPDQHRQPDSPTIQCTIKVKQFFPADAARRP